MRKPDRLQDLLNSLEPLYSPWQAKVKVSRDIYYRKFRNLPSLPPGVPVHEASTGRNLVDNLADQVRTDEPRIMFKANGTSKKAIEHAELMKLWGTGIMDQIEAHAVVDPWGQAKHDLIRDSAACIKYLVDMDALPDEPKRKDFSSAKDYDEALIAWRAMRADAFPYQIYALDPLQVFPAPGRKTPPAFFLEHQLRIEAEVALDYPEYKTLADRGTHTRAALNMVNWLEYWDPDHYIVEVEGQRIIDKENPYGFCPYAWEYNGLGRHDVSGSLSFLGEPVLETVVGELEEEVRVKTAMSAQWQYHVFPRLITTLAAALAKKMFMKGPGGIITVPDMAQAPKWLEVQAPNAQMVQFLQEVKGAIASRFPPGLNQRPPGVEAAVHQALLQGQATKPLQPIKSALNRLATSVLNGMARQAKIMYLDTNVFGKFGKTEKNRMVTADDFTNFNFDVKFEATDPSEDDRKLLTGTALLRVPNLLSNQSFYDKFGPGLGINYEEEQVRIGSERLVQQMIDMGMMTQSIMEEIMAEETQAGEAGTLDAVRQAATGAAQDVTGSRERGLEALGGAPAREAAPEAQGELP